MSTNSFSIEASQLPDFARRLHSGDRILLSGTIYTSRDAAHKRIVTLLDNGQELPYPLKGAVIYYSGATPPPPGLPIGSCGPTTSGRMDCYAPRLYDLGVAATIGKGGRSEEVAEAIRRNSAVYLCAIGGAGALAAQKVVSCEVAAFEDLGCEAVKKIQVLDFPLIVGIDCHGGNIFNLCKKGLNGN